MIKKLSVALVLVACFSPKMIFCADTVSVVVLPFDIHAVDKRPDLKTKIPDMIGDYLKFEGVKIIPLDGEIPSVLMESPDFLEEIRNAGIRYGTDYVIWGSLTSLGQKYRLDARLLKTFGSDPPSSFSQKGENIEGLFGKVKDLSENIAMALFKRVRVDEVVVRGNNRIETDAIKRFIKTAPGDVFSEGKLSEDLKAVYAMGYFEDVKVESEDRPRGKRVIFNIVEKSTVRKITIKGNRAIKEDEINKSLTITTGSILNINRVQQNVKVIESLYKEKNYHHIKVTYKFIELQNNQADIEFTIDEGEQQKIRKIRFEGNSAYSDKELKAIMKTSEKGFFSWLTSSGEYVPEDLNQDSAKINAFYLNNGYIQARVADPDVVFEDNRIFVTIKIFEGPRFKVGKVDISGDIIKTREELLSKLKIGKEEFFNRQVLQDDITALTDLYSEEGYAYPDIAPLLDQDVEQLTVDITYKIAKGKLVYFQKININGNTKTRDKIIRRELTVYENELYSGSRLKRSVRNLHRLDYFSDIKVDPVKGSSPDKMDLNLTVVEKPTGSFSFGGGYSSTENVFAMVQLAQNNLFGKGQQLQLKAEVGGTTTRYSLSFTEPWLMDIPLSAGFDLYNWAVDYDEYDRDSTGGGVQFGYPLFDFTRVYLSYSYDISNIENIDDDASYEIWDLEGRNTTSTISSTLRYDSRDKVFNPTEGSNHSITAEYAGLGGNIGYIKYTAETGWYFPFYKNLVFFTHGETGYIQENSDKKVPDYEKFYLGGINSLRGFDWRDVSSFDRDGNEVGGDKYVQFNVELIWPIFKDAGFVSLLFFDTGNVYKASENFDLGGMRETAGFGFRWYSPMGPLRIEYGRILDKKDTDDGTGRWEFSVGQAF